MSFPRPSTTPALNTCTHASNGRLMVLACSLYLPLLLVDGAAALAASSVQVQDCRRIWDLHLAARGLTGWAPAPASPAHHHQALASQHRVRLDVGLHANHTTHHTTHSHLSQRRVVCNVSGVCAEHITRGWQRNATHRQGCLVTGILVLAAVLVNACTAHDLAAVWETARQSIRACTSGRAKQVRARW